jgi:hypothetical protein
LTGGQARLLPADWAPGGHRRPEELPWPSRERLAKVPSYDPEAAWTSPRGGRVARTHRPRRAVRARQPFQRELRSGFPSPTASVYFHSPSRDRSREGSAWASSRERVQRTRGHALTSYRPYCRRPHHHRPQRHGADRPPCRRTVRRRAAPSRDCGALTSVRLRASDQSRGVSKRNEWRRFPHRRGSDLSVHPP